VYTTVSLVTLFQGFIDAINKVNAAQASAKDVVSAMHAAEATAVPVFLDLKTILQRTYGKTNQTLLDFGLTPAKARAPLTAEQKAAAQAKAKATRIARGTASKKAKSAIKGNVSGVTVTPNTVVPAPASPAQPVTVPSNGK
jgi:peptidoglycan hydrolase CwlO-like protein